MGQDAWLELLPGLLLAVGIIAVFKGGSGWYLFRRSIYKEIYSNYLEYAMRKKSLTKLSESYYLDSRFGRHRIFYQLAAAKGEKTPQAYVIILLTSGMYVLDIKNQTGDIEASVRGDFKYQAVEKAKKGEKAKVEIKMMRNPMDEIQYFQSQIVRKLNKEELTIHPIVVFPDASTLTWKDRKMPGSVAVIHRKQVYQTIKEIHEKRADVFCESEIERMYLALAGEALAAEKHSYYSRGRAPRCTASEPIK
ncbi:NERD domain-containing protein [Muricomes sp. OA1]|nr:MULTISPECIES: nuclease-related domain-containing protein [Clostridia]MCH1971961.1 NERD domain-containing protein [Muricomes sp. OA1]MEE0201711.1 nuclease-related domain-containing protein [Muricomes sp.]GKH30761.1 hypothetical protein CE91St64_01680 [Faecalicatena contorta]